MTTIGRVTLALGVLAPLIVGCARHVDAPHPAAVTASRPATSPTPPVWPDAAPAPDAPIPDAAGPTPESGPTAGFSAREELPDANLALAQRRAKWVMDYLVGKGIAASRITVVSRGESATLCADRSAACQGKNRRVHFLVRDTGSVQVTASPSR